MADGLGAAWPFSTSSHCLKGRKRPADHLPEQPCEAEASARRAGNVNGVRQQRWVLGETILPRPSPMSTNRWLNVPLAGDRRDPLRSAAALLQWVINALHALPGPFCCGRRPPAIGWDGAAVFSPASPCRRSLAGLDGGLSSRVRAADRGPGGQRLRAQRGIPDSWPSCARFRNERRPRNRHWAGFSAIAAATHPGRFAGRWIVITLAWADDRTYLINPALCLAALWIVLGHLPESMDPDAPPANRTGWGVAGVRSLAGLPRIDLAADTAGATRPQRARRLAGAPS